MVLLFSPEHFVSNCHAPLGKEIASEGSLQGTQADFIATTSTVAISPLNSLCLRLDSKFDSTSGFPRRMYNMHDSLLPSKVAKLINLILVHPIWCGGHARLLFDPIGGLSFWGTCRSSIGRDGQGDPSLHQAHGCRGHARRNRDGEEGNHPGYVHEVSNVDGRIGSYSRDFLVWT